MLNTSARGWRRPAGGTLFVACLLLLVALATLAAACGGSDTAGHSMAKPSSSATPGPPDAAPGTVMVTPAGGSYVNLDVAETASLLERPDVTLVNVHVPYEGEIEGTDLFLDYQQAAALESALPQDKNARIVVYCRSDRMSGLAADVWADAGYTRLYNLDGGFEAWQEAGLPLLQRTPPPTIQS
jgi:rhodanese-related sulfurtransferase